MSADKVTDLRAIADAGGFGPGMSHRLLDHVATLTAQHKEIELAYHRAMNGWTNANLKVHGLKAQLAGAEDTIARQAEDRIYQHEQDTQLARYKRLEAAARRFHDFGACFACEQTDNACDLGEILDEFDAVAALNDPPRRPVRLLQGHVHGEWCPDDHFDPPSTEETP